MSGDFGKLIVVPTPIGNLGDITLRALDALRGADVIYAEDTRVTSKLLNALDVDAKRLERLDENIMDKRAQKVCDQIASGETVAYCSDAGMPAVSDPGMRLIAAAHERGLAVEVLPGASAAVCAYVASGTPFNAYYFGGFFPRRASERTAILENLRDLKAALIFYESPHRLADSLNAIAEAYPHRIGTVCRELTKVHEEICRMPLPALAAEFNERAADGDIKGEIAIVIDGPSSSEKDSALDTAIDEAKGLAAKLHGEGLSQKSIAKQLASEFGIGRNVAYEIALGAKHEKP